MLPDLESLHCFVVASEQLNFRSAARIVALSPAAFGERIKRLEEQLQVELFERTTRRVKLTSVAARLLPDVRACLQQAELCVARARAGDADAAYELTIGTRFELGLSWITPVLGSLEKAHAERCIHLSFGDTDELLSRLRRAEIDGLVTSARVTDAHLDYARLHEERYVFVAAPKLIACTPLARPADCRVHTLLELRPDLPLFRYFLDARPAREEWAFNHVQFLGTIGPVRSRLLEGAGVAVLPEYFVRGDLARGRLVELLSRTKMASDWFRLLWRRGSMRETVLRQLASELLEHPLR
jgi:DNA-binding transcriptional LysR family regulator